MKKKEVILCIGVALISIFALKYVLKHPKKEKIDYGVVWIGD